MQRRILITGAASGLGKALAEAAARDGAWVLLTDVDAEAGELARLEIAEMLRESGGDPHRLAFLPLDVRDVNAWVQAREWCRREWSGLDVLVNNAGVAVGGPIADTPLTDWDWIIDINLKGVVHGVHTFLPVFTAQGAGHMVNIASLAGIANAPNMASYNVTKAGVISLSETMRYELSRKGIHTTVVCPSFFATNIPRTCAPATRSSNWWPRRWSRARGSRGRSSRRTTSRARCSRRWTDASSCCCRTSRPGCSGRSSGWRRRRSPRGCPRRTSSSRSGSERHGRPSEDDRPRALNLFSLL